MCKSRIKPAVAPGVVASNRISSLQLHCGLCRCRVKKKNASSYSAVWISMICFLNCP